MAVLARKSCVDRKVIYENVRQLYFETSQNIANNFGDNLFKDENSSSYYRYINGLPNFDIYIGNDITEDDEFITY